MSRGFVKPDEPIKILTPEELKEVLDSLGPLIADGDADA